MEFNSDRKRMSVIVRDPVDKHVKMFTKGADSIIKARLDKRQIQERMMNDVDNFLNKASVKGLRTLLMGMRVIDPEEFAEFNRQVAEAERDVMNRERQLA